MENNKLADLLQKCLDKSICGDYWNDDIQPSMRIRYDASLLAAQIEILIELLKED